MSRGIPASALHNVYKHYYISVDATASNWRNYILGKFNHEQPGILHILDNYTSEEIERIMV